MTEGTIQGNGNAGPVFVKKCALCACGACILGWTALGLFFIGLMVTKVFGSG